MHWTLYKYVSGKQVLTRILCSINTKKYIFNSYYFLPFIYIYIYIYIYNERATLMLLLYDVDTSPIFKF